MSEEDEKTNLTAEVMDRAERKALKEKLRQEKEEAAKPYKEIDEALLKGKLNEQIKAKKKLRKRLAIGVVAVLIAGWIAVTAMAPKLGGKPYGVCKVFLENTIRFPDDLSLTSVEALRPRGSGGDSLGGLRIWYTQIDSFGQYRMENIECYFKPDDATGVALDKIFINRREVDAQKIADFNKALPAIMAGPLNLEYPPPLPDNLEDLQIQTDAFRKRLF